MLLVLSIFLFIAGTTPLVAQRNKNLPRCINHRAHPHNHKWLVRIKVTPSYGRTWTFSDAPSVVSNRILADLNDNTDEIKFTEPNGDFPDFDFNVTLAETHDGTRQAEAFVEVEGPYEESTTEITTDDGGVILRLKSGDAPYTSWQDAIDHLSKKLYSSLSNGWHNDPPCVEANGTVRRN